MTSIGASAFYGCSGLTSITIPNNVTSIGIRAFGSCSGLTSITIPNNVTSIGESAFLSCPDLTTVKIESNAIVSKNRNNNPSMKSIFGDQVKSYIIGNGVNIIGKYAFSDCSTLTSVTIPNSVTNIGEYAFYRCNGLKSITIPNSVSSIENITFAHCSSLTSVTIGSGVRGIGRYAFRDCPNLADVYCYAENVPATDSNAFEGSLIEYVTLHVLGKSMDLYAATSPWSGFGEIVPLDDIFTLTYIVDGEVYKTYDLEYGAAITPEPEPTKEGYTFSGWSTIPATMPAHNVTVTGTFTKDILGTCATPTISYANGELKFNSETEGVTFHYNIDIEDNNIKSGSSDKVQLSVTYHISVYATKEDYYDSEVATGTLCWIDQQPSTEGIVDEDAVTEVKALPVLIQSQHGTITIQGANEGTEIMVYSVNGMKQGSAISTSGFATINTSLQPGSTAIVKIGEKTIKFLVK